MTDKIDRLLPEARAFVEKLEALMCLPLGSLEVARGLSILRGERCDYTAHGIAVFGDEPQAVNAAVLALFQWAKAEGHLGRKCLWVEAERSVGRPVMGPIGNTPDRTYRGMVELIHRRKKPLQP